MRNPLDWMLDAADQRVTVLDGASVWIEHLRGTAARATPTFAGTSLDQHIGIFDFIADP